VSAIYSPSGAPVAQYPLPIIYIYAPGVSKLVPTLFYKRIDVELIVGELRYILCNVVALASLPAWHGLTRGGGGHEGTKRAGTSWKVPILYS
jgi:hypothetical protein